MVEHYTQYTVVFMSNIYVVAQGCKVYIVHNTIVNQYIGVLRLNMHKLECLFCSKIIKPFIVVCR